MARSRIARRTEKLQSGDMDSALNELEVMFDNFRTLLARVYERGIDNAKSRIFSLASPTEQSVTSSLLPTKRNLKRAPRGAAREFVEKVLAGGPKTITEIRAAAKSDVEKILSYQTVRLELERGKAAKRYKKTSDKWSMS